MASGTVIDSLVITLGLDPSKFTEGQKKALEQFAKTKAGAVSTAKDMEASGKQAANFFGSIKKEALGLFAVIVGAGGLEQFVTKTVAGTAALSRTAKLIGVSTGYLQAFRMVIQRTGADGDAAVASMQGLAQALETWRTFGTISQPLLVGLNQIGANPDEDPIKIYEKFARWAKGKDARLVNQEGQLLGFDQGSIANALKGAEVFGREMRHSIEIGVPTEEDVAKANALVAAFQNLRQAVTGWSMRALFDAAEVKEFGEMTADAQKLGDALGTVNNDLVKVGVSAKSGFGVLFGFIDHVLKEVTHLAKAMDAVAHGRWKDAASEGGKVLWEGAQAVTLGGAGVLVSAVSGKPSAQSSSRSGGVSAGGSGLASGNGSLADRNNNPGNLTDGRGRYLKFAGLEEGYAAMARQILTDFRRHGQTTIRTLIDGPHGWAPGNAPGNTARGTSNYIAFIARALGISPDATLNVQNPASLGNLMLAMHRFEAGPVRRGGTATVVNITGPITVHTAATDARGVAKALGGAIRSNMSQQANTGLTG